MKTNANVSHDATDAAKPEGVFHKRSGETGVALILALLSLVVLTFLGLTLAATTSTELQIATNYRWNQQAYFNAEAGLVVGRWVLSQFPDWTTILPGDKGTSWSETECIESPPCTPPAGGTGRDYENATCDGRGNGRGYGRILADELNNRYENVTYVDRLGDAHVNGSFTLWVRRTLLSNSELGTYRDNPETAVLIMTSEGTAPFHNELGQNWFTQANQAVQVLEMELTQSLLPPCQPGAPQHDAQGSPLCR
jgi:hypothetical protein